MPMTKEERNQNRASARFRKQSRAYQSLLQHTLESFQRMHDEHWTWQKMLEYRSQWILPYAGKLPSAWQCQLSGVFDACFALMYKRLVFCYPHPDTGTLTPAKELGDMGLSSRLDCNAGHYCHVTPNGYVIHS